MYNYDTEIKTYNSCMLTKLSTIDNYKNIKHDTPSS